MTDPDFVKGWTEAEREEVENNRKLVENERQHRQMLPSSYEKVLNIYQERLDKNPIKQAALREKIEACEATLEKATCDRSTL